MNWQQVRTHYPRQWLLVEAVRAHSERGKRILDELAVVSACRNSNEAMREYLNLHRQMPQREFYVLHTDKENLEITERRWLGIRGVQ